LKNQIQKRKNEIIDHYKKNWSVSQIIKDFELTGGTRRYISEILKDEGIYQGIGGKNAFARVKKIESTMLERYGVINSGQLPGYGWSSQNKIHKIEIEFKKDLDKYCRRVRTLTGENSKNLLKSDFCYYTGIKFADSINKKVNPNDYLKRSLDHKLPVLYGFYLDISPEEISSVSNLVFCIKYANAIKGNMTEEQFKPLAFLIREKLINEGKESN